MKEGVGVAAGARMILVLVPEVILQAVVRTRGFHELSDTVLARVLRSDRLAVDELDLVQAVREWAHVSSVSAAQRGRGGSQNTPPVPDAELGVLQAVLGRPVPEVAALPVRELRLPLLAPSELATLESHNQRDLLIPVSCLDFVGLDLGFGGKLGPHSCPHPRWRASRQPGGPTRCGVAAGCPPSSAGPGAARGPATTTGTWTRTPSRGCALPPAPPGGSGRGCAPPAGCSAMGQAVGCGAGRQ